MQHTPSEHIGSLVPLYGANSGAAGGGLVFPDHQTARFIVGNALAGDTIAVCDFLDPGDGTGIAAALEAAQTLLTDTGVASDVYARPGVYTLPNGTALGIPAGCKLYGAGKGRTILVVPPGDAHTPAWATVELRGKYAWLSDLTFAMASINTALAIPGMYGVVNVFATRTTVRDVEFRALGNPTFTVTGTPWITCINLRIPSVDSLFVENVEGYFDEQDCTFSGTGTLSFNLVGSYDTTTLGYDGSSGRPTLRKLTFRCHYTAAGHVVPEAVYMRRFVAFDLDTLIATHVYTGVYVYDRDGGKTFGPNIHNVLHHAPPETGCSSVVVQLRSTVTANPLENTHIENVRMTWDGVVGATVYPVSVWTHNTTTAVLRNVVVTSVQVQRTSSNGTVRVELMPLGTALLRNVAVDKVRLPQAASLIYLGDAAGNLQDCVCTDSHTLDLTVAASCVDAIIANNRIYGTFTNSGVGTSISNNIT